MTRHARRLALVGTALMPPEVGPQARRYNLAIAYLEAAVREDPGAPDVRRFDVPFWLDRLVFTEETVKEILAYRPHVLGLSCYCWDLDAQLDLAAQAAAALPGLRVIVGGPAASADPPAILAAAPAVGTVVVGEGEATLVELLRGKDPAVAGTVTRDGSGAAQQNPPRKLITPLDSIPSPLLTGALSPPKQNVMLELSRGCPLKCAYCAWKLQGARVRSLSSSRVEDELRGALATGAEHGFVIDSAINRTDAQLSRLCDAVGRVDRGHQLALSFFLDWRRVSARQVKKLSALRVHEITVGLETLSSEAAALTGRKPVDPEAFEGRVELLKEVGPVTICIILGMPGDTLQGFEKTLGFLARLAEKPGEPRVRSIRIHWMILPQGTQLWKERRRLGLTIHSPGVPYVTSSPSFPAADMARAFDLIRGHRAAHLFLWDDLELDVDHVHVASGDHLGGRSGHRVTAGEVLRSIHPLKEGSTLPGGFVVSELGDFRGFPLIRLAHPSRGEVTVQLRSRGSDPSPLLRTARHDIVEIHTKNRTAAARKVSEVLLAIIARNDREGGPS